MLSFLLAFVLAQTPPAPIVPPKAVITDQRGNPPPAMMPFGEAIYLSAFKADKDGTVVWEVEPDDRAERIGTFEKGEVVCIPLGDSRLPDGITPKPPYLLTIRQTVAKGGVPSTARVRINIGGIPPKPPDPKPPDPPVPPIPPPVPGQKLHVSVFRKSSEMTPAIGAVLNDSAMRKSLAEKGHQFRVFDVDTDVDEQKRFVNVIANAGGTPCLILQQKDGKVVTAIKLPATSAAIVEEIRKVGG